MITLNPLFSDGAVLQRGKPLPVWGKGLPFVPVSLTLNGITVNGISDEEGNFFVTFPAFDAGGPYEMLVSAGEEKLLVHDILVGEVWIASGQSNMAFHLGQLNTNQQRELGPDIQGLFPPEFDQFHQLVDGTACADQIRMLTVPHMASGRREKSFHAQWEKAGDRTASAEFSAVGSWFAYVLYQKLGIPVGIVNSSWGGTRIEAWTSAATLRENPETAVLLQRQMDDTQKAELYASLIHGNESDPYANLRCPSEVQFFLDDKNSQICDDSVNEGEKNGWAELEFDDSGWRDITLPASWKRAGYAANGVVWVRQHFQWDGPVSSTGTAVVKLGPVDKQDVTYINGVEVGRMGNAGDCGFWEVPRIYSFPAKLLRKGDNVVAIRARSHMYDGSITITPGRSGIESDGHFAPLQKNWRFAVEKEYGDLSPENNENSIAFLPGYINQPSILFDAMIRPLLPCAMRGVIWYQGENNATTLQRAKRYCRLMKDLITDWRQHWENGNFPFVMAELAGYYEPRTMELAAPWAFLRQAQLQAAAEMEATGCIPLADSGEATDIHPRKKRIVGERMAGWALKRVYGEAGEISDGPVALACRRLQPGVVRILWKSELSLRAKLPLEKSFVFLTDMGTQLSCTEAKMIGPRELELRYEADVLDMPTRVYYGWASNAPAAIEHEGGWPAHPFCLPIC